MSDASPLPQGSTIGILGGGQLGRMLALAAARLGMKTHIYCPDPESPAFDVTPLKTVAAYDDEAALAAFAAGVDVVTYEFENVPAKTAAFLADLKPLRPGANALAVSQDRLAEKAFLTINRIPVAPFAAITDLDATTARLVGLRDALVAGIEDGIPEAILNGPRGANRLPGNVHFTFPGCEGDSLLMLLDAAGIECSTGSACTAGVARASHVLIAMGADPRIARGSLRFSLGHTSTRADVDAVIAALPQVVERARAAGLASAAGRGGDGR